MNSPRTVISKVLSSGAWLALGLLLGRISGFVREAVIASRFGLSNEADVIILILTIPDILATMLMGGALSAVLIPELKQGNKQHARTLFIQASLLMAAVFAVLAAAITLISSWVIIIFAPGLSQSNVLLASEGISIAIWILPLTVLSGVSTAFLQANERFAVAAMGTLIVNLSILAGLIFIDLSTNTAFIYIGYFVVLGGLLRWLSQAFQARALIADTIVAKGWVIDRSLIVRYLQALGASSVMILLPVIARASASLEGEGGIAALNYSIKLVEFPLGVFISVISVALFPFIARQHQDDSSMLLIRSGLRFVILTSILITILSVWFRQDLVTWVYGWGVLTTEELAFIALLAAIGFVGLPARGIHAIIVNGFNARKDTRTPMLVSMLSLVLLIPLVFWAGNYWGIVGVAIVLTAIYVFSALVLFVLFKLTSEYPLILGEGFRHFFSAVFFGALLCTISVWFGELYSFSAIILLPVGFFLGMLPWILLNRSLLINQK